jgi:hypothetical protein
LSIDTSNGYSEWAAHGEYQAERGFDRQASMMSVVSFVGLNLSFPAATRDKT